MKCEQFHCRLEEAIECRHPAGPELIVHGEQCHDLRCRQAWADYVLLEAALDAWQPVAATCDLVDRVREDLGRERGAIVETRTASVRVSCTPVSESTRSHRGGAMVLVGAVAGVLLAVGLLLRTGEQDRELARQNVLPAESSHLAATVGTEEDAIEEVEERVKIGARYAGFAQTATYAVTDLALLVVPGSRDPSDAEDPDSEWLQKFEERLEPVRQNVGGQLDKWFSAPLLLDPRGDRT